MANVSRTIDIIFAGTDKVSGVIKTVTGNMDSLAGGFADVSAPLANIADNVLKMEAALSALAVGGLTYAFIKSKDYESAIIDLEKVMGENEEVTGELEDSFKSLSQVYGESTITIVDSLAGLRQSGYDTADGMLILEASLKIARASELSAEEATNLLKRALIGYNLEATDAVRIGDLWNQTSNVANTTVGKLAEGFAIVSRQASDAGFSLTETSAVLTPIIGVFDSGSEAGIAFSMALTRILNPTAEGEAAIRALTGVTGPLNEEFSNGRELFEAVAIGLQNVDERTGTVAVAQITGAEQAKRIKIAFDDYFETLKKIGPASEQYNSLQKEVDKQNESSQTSVDRLAAGFETLAIIIGEQFRAAATEAIDGGTSIENVLESMVSDGTFKPIFDQLNIFGKSLGSYLEAIAEAMPDAFDDVDFSNLLEAVEGLGGNVHDLFKAIFGDLDLTDADDLAKAIQKIVDGVTLLTNVSSGILEGLEPLGKLIGKTIDEFVDSDGDLQDFIGNILGVGKAINVLAGVAQVVTGPIEVLANGLVALAAIKYTGISVGLGAVAAAFAPFAIGGAIGAGVAALGMYISDKLTPAVKELPKEIDFTVTLDDGDILDLITGIITDAEGNTISIPVVLDDSQFYAESTNDQVKELLETGATDTEINYTISGDTTDLEQYLKEAGVLITEEMAATAAKVETELVELSDGRIIEVEIVPTPDWAATTENVKKDIEDIPTDRQVEISLQGDIDKQLATIEANAKLVQASMEWTAKVDIAEAEAGAKIMVAAFSSVDSTIAATSGNISSLFGLMAGDVDLRAMWAMEEQIKLENKLREDAWKMQEKLLESQRQYNMARTEAIKEGGGEIIIKMENVEPHVEAIMWEVIKAVQIRATADGSEFLLGIPT